MLLPHLHFSLLSSGGYTLHFVAVTLYTSWRLHAPRLLGLELVRVLDVLLRKDAEQVATHREGLGEQVGGDAVAGDEDRLLREAWEQ